MSSQAGPSNREDLIRNAILFLNDPKVQSSSLTSRIQFLESKGLTEPEIQRALSDAQNQNQPGHTGETSGKFSGYDPRPYGGYGGGYAGGGGAGGGTGFGQMMAPQVPGRDWRDLFIMAVVSGGVVYGLTTLARKYLLPHLQPPSSSTFQQTSTSLTESYDQAAQLLTDLQAQTTSLQQSVESDRERVNRVVDEVEEVLKSLKEGEEGWRGEMREIRGEVEGVRELVPRMIEKHAAGQSSSLQDLSNELRSLKTLMQARQLAPSTPSAGSLNGHSNGNASGMSSTTEAANNLLGGSRSKGRGIPAWQMQGGEGEVGGSASASEGGGSLAGSGVLEKPLEGEAGQA